MKYIVCEEPGQFLVKEKSEPILQENQVLIQMTRIGICGTDLHAFQGNQPFFQYPRILGHELAGAVLKAGPGVTAFQAGDRVGIMPYVSCGKCIACRRGKPNCCTSIQVLGVHSDGGMQERIVLSQDLLLSANHLEWEEIAILEPLAISAHAIRRSQVMANDTVVVMGCGPIGIGVMAFAQMEGARVIALDVQDSRLEFVRENLGIKDTVNVLKGDAAEQVEKMTAGDMAQIVFDATGNKRALESGINYMSHGGKFVLVGLFKGELSYQHPAIHAKETSLLCSRNATREDFDYVMDKLNEKRFPVNSFVTHTVPFLDMPQHFEDWLKPETGVIKAMLELSS
ncbi:MAG: zinc-binding alcohol dehydrogenase family protein [Saprospiraceae bacterium]|nr:zinc-binding alcohol dehydrogenase family protein [Saprospiraceae bacterium]